MFMGGRNKALLHSWSPHLFNQISYVCIGSVYLYSWWILFLKGFHCLIFSFKRNVIRNMLVAGEYKMNKALFL